METIRGKVSRELNLNKLSDQLGSYDQAALDLGTGDGRYVRYLAERHPRWFVIGVDSCRENLHEHSRAKLPNALFIIARAQHLPNELSGLISQLTINFPWGSLLDSLLAADPALMDGLASILGHIAAVDVRLNSGALAEAGTTLEAGAGKIHDNLLRLGWRVKDPVIVDVPALREFPSTWARRLAAGRDPRAMVISGWITPMNTR